MPDPTPLDYEEPVEHTEWGAALPSGESVRLLDEETARLVCQGNPDAILIRRKVVYQPWIVVRA